MVNPEIDDNGDKFWRNGQGQYHREDGPAIEYANGSMCWFINDQFHREDGPAVERVDGTRRWYINDQFHREDGPAIEWSDGSRWWFLDGARFTEEEYKFIQFMKGIKVNG